jgi:pimeloyl-ACP methyl ester carboxylesterase
MSTTSRSTAEKLERPDGRVLEFFSAGAEDGTPLIMNHGTPSCGMVARPWAEVCAERGLRLVGYSRPGYGESTRQEGRSIADCAEDVAAVADALGAGRFYIEGHSGGGSHALACAALLPDRVLAAAVIAGAAPKDLMGPAWWEGNAEENMEEFRAAEVGGDTLRTVIENWRDEMLAPSGDDIDESLESYGSLVSDVDRRAVTPEANAFMMARRRHSIGKSIWGWFDDDLTETKPWGFELESIRVPVSLWQGGQDRFVPRGHFDWLAAHVPGAGAHFLPDDGHWSIKEFRLGEVVDDLVARGRGA